MSAPSLSVEVLAGGRAEPEAWTERADEGEAEAGEAAALGGTVGAARIAGRVAWAALDWRVFGYLPEAEGTLVRPAPAAGFATGTPSGPHASAAGSWALEWTPATPDVSGGRAELTARAGTGAGAHVVDAVLDGLDHRFFAHPDWRVSAVALGPAWRFTPGAVRVSVAPSGQVNAGDGGLGGQARLATQVGVAARGVDASLAWQLFVAEGGGTDRVYRPPFDPLGSVDEDADALSAGGFVQHRLEALVTGTAGPWSGTAHAVGRVRAGASSGTTAHVGADVARALSSRTWVHVAGGWTGWALGGVALSDPYGWVALEWRTPPTP